MKHKQTVMAAALVMPAVLILILASCAGSPKAASTSVSASAAAPAIAPAESVEGIPDFVTNPPQSPTLLYGVGSASQSNQQLAITMAESRARQSLASQLQITVQGAIEDYIQESGVTGSTQAIEFSEVVGRQILNVNLKGATVVQRAKSDDGTWWVLISYDKTAAAAEAAAVINSEASQYAEFKNWQAQQDLDKLLQTYTGAPTPVSE
jgi:archaellum component FlaG (FlaF/FlaG flagellin family)